MYLDINLKYVCIIMNKNVYLNFIMLVAILSLAEISLTSCSGPESDPTPNKIPNPNQINPIDTSKIEEPAFSIIGEWLEDDSTNDLVCLFVSKYEEDGTFRSWLKYVSFQYNIYKNEIGSFSYNDNALTEKYVDSNTNENILANYEVRSLDRYTMKLFYIDGSSLSLHHRIIDTYKMTVGDSKSIQISDNDFSPTSYKSSDDRVAIVSDGIITAIKRGTAYISVISDIGTAIVRVIVNDPDNLIDNYSVYLGNSIDNLTEEVGHFYYEDTMNDEIKFRRYNLVDDLISSVAFLYNKNNVVKTVIADIRDGADKNSITKGLEKKYEIENIIDGVYYFITNINEKEVKIVWDPVDMNTVTYQYTQNEDNHFSFEDIDNLILLTAEEAAKQLDHKITENDWIDECFVSIITSKEIYSVLVEFDKESHNVTEINIRCASGLTRENLEGWFKDRYFSTGDDKYPYANFNSKGKDKQGRNVQEQDSYRIGFSVGRSNGATYINYVRGGVNDVNPTTREMILEDFDKLITFDLEKTTEFFSYDLSSIERFRFSLQGGTLTFPVVDNELFTSASCHFPRTVLLSNDAITDNKTVTLKCAKGISREDIEWWYKDHYYQTSDTHEYQLNENNDIGNVYVDFEFDSDSCMYIKYERISKSKVIRFYE